MKRIVLFLLLPALIMPASTLYCQLVIRNNNPVSVSYGSGKVNRVFVPPPKEYQNAKGSKGGTIKVYYSGFTSTPKAAFGYAASILSSLLPDDVSLTVRATWGPLADASVLGSTGVSSYFGGSFINAFNPFVYYPVALAEKIAGTKLNTDEEGDVIMSINSRVKWYTGIDGKTPDDMYDLVTVVLHELIHGLGFVDSFYTSGTTGSYGLNTVPLIYDSFVENQDGYRLTDNNRFQNGSAALYSQLTGNALYFGGPVLRIANNGPRVRLFAPSAWNAGSSIAHLNENTMPQVNALMTPYIDLGEAIHSPGSYALGILGDLGWINTKIIHQKFNDTESALSSVDFRAVIKSDTTFDRNFIGLVYSFNNTVLTDTLFFLPPPVGDTFNLNLPVPAYNTTISYYIFVKDRFDRIFRLPSTGILKPYKFYIGTDTVKPELAHDRIEYLFDKTRSAKFVAKASDNIGIDTVYVEYRKNQGTLSSFGLANDSLDSFSSYLDIKGLTITGNDSIQYRLVAIDSSSSSNRKTIPANGFYTIKFEPTLAVVESYVTDFTSAASDFLNRGFSVTKPSQFPDAALHTRHPYESPEVDDGHLEYTAVLRYPIKVHESGIAVSFREIVLVEPGEVGSTYGSADFYDYVVVEATRDFGKIWFPLADGYDSRISSVFLNAYNQSINGNNSTYVGTPDMFSNRTIDIRTFTKFDKNDTLLIRFRLYSDPYAHGWGWAIDDLNIKSVAAGIEKSENTGFRIYPNPGNGMMKIDSDEPYGKRVYFIVSGINGNIVSSGIINAGIDNSIDISSQAPGIYIIKLKSGVSERIIRYVKLK